MCHTSIRSSWPFQCCWTLHSVTELQPGSFHVHLTRELLLTHPHKHTQTHTHTIDSTPSLQQVVMCLYHLQKQGYLQNNYSHFFNSLFFCSMLGPGDHETRAANKKLETEATSWLPTFGGHDPKLWSTKSEWILEISETKCSGCWPLGVASVTKAV